MSATVETNNVSWRKRKRQEEATNLQIEMKKPRVYYYRLASESSKNSEEDTESIYSIQDQETDVVRDTTDTASKSGSDADEYELFEYEVASLSENDQDIIANSTSDSDENVLFAAIGAIGAMCDSSLENWITDCEESDNSSSLDDSVVKTMGFSTCVQCKSQNDNPLYRYCEKCFQTCKQCKKRKTYKCFPLCITCHKDRKKFFPPRPRGNKKAKRKATESPVKLDTLRSCLNGLASQDSGIGSSQECPPLDLDQIVVPDQHLKPGTSKISSIEKERESLETERELRRKRQASESSLSDFEIKKPKYTRNSIIEKVNESNSRPSSRNQNQNDKSQLKNNDEQTSSQLSSGTFSSQVSIESPFPTQVSTEMSSLSQESTSGKSSSLSQESNRITLSQDLTESPSKRSMTLRSAQSKLLTSSQNSDSTISNSITSTSSTSTSLSNPETTELCIMCNSAPKNSIFLHTNIGHQCCCYKCAKRTLHTIKRCPICNRSVNKVIKILTS